MKGIILAGGSGTRLYPSTLVVSKQLLPVFDKPMIYYPLSTLMQAGIREVLLISTKHDLPKFQQLFGDGSKIGLEMSYLAQDQPNGIAEAFILGEKFIGKSPVALILGDNFFHGSKLPDVLEKASLLKKGALIFAYRVQDPSRYGVVVFHQNKVIEIQEKPHKPISPYAIPGLYFYDEKVVSYAKEIQPSSRGELEITDIHQKYLEKGLLSCQVLEKGFAWLDTGTPSALIEASHFVKTLEDNQGIKIGCIEEIALQKGFVDKSAIKAAAKKYKNAYGNYLETLSF